MVVARPFAAAVSLSTNSRKVFFHTLPINNNYKTAGDVGHDHEETNSGGISEDVMDWFFSEFNGVWKSTFC